MNGDVILVDGDPTTDISALRRIAMVTKGTDVYTRPKSTPRSASSRSCRLRPCGDLNSRGAATPHTSRFDTSSAFLSMNSRRGSTSSPISVENSSLAACASSMRTCTSRRVSGLMVVSQS